MAKPKPIKFREANAELSPDNLIPTFIVYDLSAEELVDTLVDNFSTQHACHENHFDTEAQAIQVAKEHLDQCNGEAMFDEGEDFVIIFKAVKVLKANFNPIYTSLPIKY